MGRIASHRRKEGLFFPAFNLFSTSIQKAESNNLSPGSFQVITQPQPQTAGPLELSARDADINLLSVGEKRHKTD